VDDGRAGCDVRCRRRMPLRLPRPSSPFPPHDPSAEKRPTAGARSHLPEARPAPEPGQGTAPCRHEVALAPISLSFDAGAAAQRVPGTPAEALLERALSLRTR